MKLLKKVLKIVIIVLSIVLVILYLLFVNFSAPKSNDKVIQSFKNEGLEVNIAFKKYKEFTYRVVASQKVIDSNKTSLVFVHGAIGSAIDFKKYMTDSLLLKKYNMISYDRVGYNYNDKTLAQKNLKFEVAVLNNLLKKLDSDNTILIGYSYGGPIVLSSEKKYKSILLLAPAVYSKVEPMPFMLNFYKWKITRWLVPHVWKSASLEKMSHKEELSLYEKTWFNNPSKIISIHGDDDGIVPYQNSLYLKEQFPKHQFELKTIKKEGHSLVWTSFEFIKKELLKLSY